MSPLIGMTDEQMRHYRSSGQPIGSAKSRRRHRGISDTGVRRITLSAGGWKVPSWWVGLRAVSNYRDVTRRRGRDTSSVFAPRLDPTTRRLALDVCVR